MLLQLLVFLMFLPWLYFTYTTAFCSPFYVHLYGSFSYAVLLYCTTPWK